MLQERLEEEFRKALELFGKPPALACIHPNTWEKLMYEITGGKTYYTKNSCNDIKYNYSGYILDILRSPDVAEGEFIIR